MAVHDRLRQPRRARAVEHPERMIRRHAARTRAARPRRWRRSSSQPSASPSPAERRIRVEVAEHDRVLDRRQRREQLLTTAEPVEVLAAVAVAVDGEQHLRLDLGEAVDHAPGAEVRRAARPDRADRRAGEERGDRLGNVRQVRDHAVARPDAERAQAAARAAPPPPRSSPRVSSRRAAAARTHAESRRHRRRRGRSTCSAKLSRAPGNHSAPGIAREPSTRSYGADAIDVEALPDRRPEPLEVGRRPLPQARVVRQLEPTRAARASACSR